jgi:hypothetical protein
MPATRHRFSKCSHKGFGAECHRCGEAARMDRIAEGQEKPGGQGGQRKNPKKNAVSFKGWKPADFHAEAARLRAPRGSKVAEPTLS